MVDIRTVPIEADKFYHLYNRGINGCDIFRSRANYQFFLEKTTRYLLPVCEVYAYCLMPNHFHLLVKIKSDEALRNVAQARTSTNQVKGLHAADRIFSRQFSLVFNSYSQAYNKMYNRHGALIESPFKRQEIKTDRQLLNTIIYIHQNPKNHSLVEDFRNYEFSSFNAILRKSATRIERDAVLAFFENTDNFIFCHQATHENLDFD